MFKNLRNKFLLLNMVIISLAMVMAFGSIYLITYNNVNNTISRELHSASEMKQPGERDPNREPNREPEQNREPERLNLRVEDNGTMPPRNSQRQMPPANVSRPEMSMSFTVYLDRDQNFSRVESVFSAEDEYYAYMVDRALNMHQRQGRFSDSDGTWAYIKGNFPGNNETKITFLDVTSQVKILNNLIYTFILVAVVMFVVIYFISRNFANRAINPIKLTFEKQAQFISDASHELKTPLSVIQLNADVLVNNPDEPVSGLMKWVGNIKYEAERMANLTNELLYLASVDNYQDQERSNFTYFQLSEAVEECILPMEAMIYEKGFFFAIDIEPGIDYYGNEEQLKRVVIILLDNAVKYTEAQGEIYLGLYQTHSGIVLRVENTGEAIPDGEVENIFDRFYRVDKSRARKSGGHGLGLAIAKETLTRHGSAISARSQGGWTMFKVELKEVKSH